MNAIKLIYRCQLSPFSDDRTVKRSSSTIFLVPRSDPKSLKNIIATFAIVALATLAGSNARATLIAYEPFNYTLGTQLNVTTTASGTPTQTTGGGFVGGWGASDPGYTITNGLSYPGLLSGHNSLKITVNGSYNQEALASSISSGTVYISYLFVPGTEQNGGNNGAGFLDNGIQICPGGAGLFLGVEAYGATQGKFTVINVTGSYNDAGGTQVYQTASPDITYGTTNLIVLKLVNTGGNTWDGAIWVNPPAGTSETASNGSFTAISFGGAIGTAAFLNRSGPGNSLTFDEFRIGATWNDAVSYSPPTPLNVSITSPANSSTVGNNVTINASASIYPGTVTNVSFFDGATLLSSSTSQPYTYNATLLAGAHTLSAIAYANSNSILVTATNAISITVTDTPPLVVYEPFNYASIANGTAANGTGESGTWSIAAASHIVSGNLTYPGITPANNSLDVNSARAAVNFVNPIARGGTKWISYLVNMNGNCGGTPTGVYLKNGGTGLWVGQGLIGISASTGPLYISTTDTTSTGGPQPNGILSPQFVYNFGQTYLVVVEIQFNTGGGNDTIIAYINPTAATNTPTGYLAALTNNSPINVGAITGFGVQNAGCGDNVVDELRVGDSFGSVVGAATPTIVTTVSVSTNLVNLVTWPASSANAYQPQSSPDNSTWSNVGGPIIGATPNSITDPSLAPYYQILEYTPVTIEEAYNGNFDYDTGLVPDTATGWNSVQSQPPVWISTDGHASMGCMDLAVTNMGSPAPANGSEVQQNTYNATGNAITPGNTYNFSFWAKQISTGPSYVQFYAIQWLNGPAYISQVTANFSGGNGSWAQISANNLVAPAGATTALIQIIGNTGAVDGGYGEVLVDDVSLASSSLTGGPNILTPAVQSESAFTATIKTNGVTAAAATGTVTFKTNSVQLSLNSVASGVAASAGAVLNPPYTVTAVYSGDFVYVGSTGILVVGGTGPTGPGSITSSVSGNVLKLTWPSNQTWRLVGQTNNLATGLNPSPSAWFTVPGGIDGSNSITINPGNAAVFYKLVSP